MNVICTQQIKCGKHFILPQEIYQAIYSEDRSQVSILLRGAKIAQISKETFDAHFKEKKGG